MIGGGGGAMAAMNKSLKDNKRLKGDRTSYFKKKRKGRTIYEKQIDKNAGKMTQQEFEEFKQTLRKEKRIKTIKNAIIISVFIGLTIFGFFYLGVF